jgi:hypothetical protein
VSLGEGCGKSQILEQKERTLFLCPLTSEFNLNAIGKFSTLLPEVTASPFQVPIIESCLLRESDETHVNTQGEKCRDCGNYSNDK